MDSETSYKDEIAHLTDNHSDDENDDDLVSSSEVEIAPSAEQEWDGASVDSKKRMYTPMSVDCHS